MDEADLQARLIALHNEVEVLKARLKEDEAVIASLQAWTQYGLGTLIKHLSDPESLDRSEVTHLLETVFARMYRTLKVGFRGEAEQVDSNDGFDRLYGCAQETIDMWKSKDDLLFADQPDDSGQKLRHAALDMLGRIDPIVQQYFPFESNAEKQSRTAARLAIHQVQRRQS